MTLNTLKALFDNKTFKRVAQGGLTLIVLVFLAAYIFRRWQEVDVVSLSFNWPLVLASSLSLVVFYLFFSRSWRRTLIFVKADLESFTWLDLHRVFIYAFLTRYLPAGNVVTIGSRVGFYKAMGGSASKGFESVYHEQIYLTLGAFVLTATALAAAPVQALPSVVAAYRWPLVIGLSASVLALGLAMDWVLELVSRVIPISAIENMGAVFQPWQKAELLGRFIIINVVQGAAAYLGVYSIYPDLPKDWTSMLLIGAAYPMSRFIGQVAAIVPGGLGVREGAFAFFLGSFLPVQPLVLGGGIIRLLSVIVELFNAAFLYLLNRYSKPDPVVPETNPVDLRHRDPGGD